MVLLVCLVSTGAMAQLPYFTDFQFALDCARDNGKILILYTGSKELCPGQEPKAFFFGPVLAAHLPLGARSNAFVVCEQFLDQPSHEPNGGPSAMFVAEVFRYDALFTRYQIKSYQPAITLLDTNGAALSGPYIYTAAANTFSPARMDSGKTLKEYISANPIFQTAVAPSNALSSLTLTNLSTPVASVEQ